MQYGLIGEKLGHSFSKIVHSKLADYDYELKEIARQDLDEFMNLKDFKAINVTIPYKESVIKYLDFVDELAQKIGAVNTVVNNNGKLYGYNTDFLGLKALIEKTGIEIKGKKVLILGSGGTSKTAFAVAESMSAAEILRVSRTESEGLITYEQAVTEHNDVEIIINTTPVGMYDKIGVLPIDIGAFERLEGVIDAVYNPLNSALVCEARQRGIKACGGLYMLVAQAAFAVEKFLNLQIPKSDIQKVYADILNEKKNIVLIGMPSSGKSTVGKLLANSLNKQFIDTDSEIVKLTRMEIPEIFKEYGEAHFRELESLVIANVSLKQNAVIATGGGAVLNPRNIELLKENGFLVFLDRSVENLITTDDRPLSSTIEALTERYNERYDIYCSSADLIIDANGSVEENVNKVKEGFINENLSN